jgi:PAS domain-containing protein
MAEWFRKLRGRAAQSQTVVQRTCALCGSGLGDPIASEQRTSGDLPRYDLCQRCENRLFAQWGLPFQEYLDELEIPIVITDDNVVLKAANRAACELLGKEAAQMKGRLGGLVFECEHALEPEGCGRTIHCSGCVIRNAVTDSYLTGAPHLRLPATLDRGTPEGGIQQRLLISTLRRDNVVLLKIERDTA